MSFLLITTFISLTLSEITFCQIGLDPVGILTTKYALQKGYKLVAAFTNDTSQTSTDISTLLSLKTPLNITPKNLRYLEKTLSRTKPNICIYTLGNTLEDIFVNSRVILNEKINIITLNIQMIYPNSAFDWKAKSLIHVLNDAAIENDVTIYGSGLHDSIVYPMVIGASAGMFELEEIYVRLVDVRDVGSELDGFKVSNVKEKSIGNKFMEMIALHARGNAELIINGLGLTLKINENNQKMLYTRYDCYTIDSTKDDCIGVNISAKGITNEGVLILFNNIIGLENENNKDLSSLIVNFKGKPNDFKIEINKIDVDLFGAMALVNRISSVINMKKGFYNALDVDNNAYFDKNRLSNEKVAETEENDEQSKDKQETTQQCNDDSCKA